MLIGGAFSMWWQRSVIGAPAALARGSRTTIKHLTIHHCSVDVAHRLALCAKMAHADDR
jgi:hypothetical protein